MLRVLFWVSGLRFSVWLGLDGLSLQRVECKDGASPIKSLKIESHALDGCRVLQYSTCFLCHTEVAEVQFHCMKVMRGHPRKIA
jgi:hypothetical protein